MRRERKDGDLREDRFSLKGNHLGREGKSLGAFKTSLSQGRFMGTKEE